MLKDVIIAPDFSSVTFADLGVYGVGLGVLLAFLGIAAALSPRDRVLRRLAAQGPRRRDAGFEAGLLRPMSEAPSGLMKTLIPADDKERTQVQRHLALAGLTGPNAVRSYYLARLGFGIVLPLLLLGTIAAAQAGYLTLPRPLASRVNALTKLHLVQIAAVLVWVGFFGPAYWLKAKADARRDAIRMAFPNALDLLQISVEAGLGLDAAMIRVGNELAVAAPELSQEFLAAQREIQAGRNRDRALLDMAARTQVDEVASFVNVVLQSIQFGADISGVLINYASDMRLHRELRAQEKANRLPVQMSAVMALLMLPALLILTIGPVALRYVRFFSG